MITVDIPKDYKKEVSWVFDVLLRDWLCVDYILKFSLELDSIIISTGKRRIILPTIFFDKYYYKKNLDDLELSYFNTKDLNRELLNEIPVIFGNPKIQYDDSIICSIDIIGFIFFMLSRYECLNEKIKLDEHGRFLAKKSVALKFGFLDYPVVDLYVELLLSLIFMIDNKIDIRRPKGNIVVSCDVDIPYECSTKNIYLLMRSSLGDFTKRKHYKKPFKRIVNYIATYLGYCKLDPYDTFTWYLNECLKYKHNVIFYFISSDNKSKHDGCYELNEPRIKHLIDNICKLGYVVGVHGSFYSKDKNKALLNEKNNLEKITGKKIVHNRQHVLKFNHCTTPKKLEEAGFQFDSSGGYADHPGFMYGTGREFRMWDLINREPLNLVQQPLILMDCSLMAKRYMNLPVSEAKEYANKLKYRSLKYGGNFTFLWHNSSLESSDDIEVFQSLLQD